jgi:hypothetical protein
VGWNRIGELIFRFFWHFRFLQAQERAAAEAAKAASRSRPQVTTHLNTTQTEIDLAIVLDCAWLVATTNHDVGSSST